MRIEKTAEEWVIKLPLDMDIAEIQRFLNYLRFKEIAAKSTATQEDVDALAQSVNKNWWEQNKDRFLPEKS